MSKQLRIWLFVLLGSLLASSSLPAEGVITLTTSRAVGEKIGLKIRANGRVTIEGVKGSAQEDGYYNRYTLTSQTVTIRGDVTYLECSSNQLTSLDVSDCTALTYLDCDYNQLTSLDVSGCTALTRLDCDYNQLTILEASGCTALTKLNCYDNPLTSINLSGCQSLKSFWWPDSKLTRLKVSGCTSLTKLECYNNQLTSLDASGCTSLTTLNCSSNPLTSVNLSGCQSLKEFSLTRGKLTSLDVSGCIVLTKLDCDGNQLTSLNVSGCTSLTTLDCSKNQLTSLDVSGCTALTRLDYDRNPLTSINLSGCQSLKEFFENGSELTNLNVSGCTALTTLDCYENQLTSLDVSGCTALTTLDCRDNQLTSLDVSGCTALTWLRCSRNQLTSLNVSGSTALTRLICEDNRLTSLDVSGCASLTKLVCCNNHINGEKMTNLVNSLPNRKGMTAGDFVVVRDIQSEKNQCRPSDLAIAKGKNWRPQRPDGSPYSVSIGNDVSTMTTAKAIGETIDLSIKADGDIIIKGVKDTPLPDGKTHSCTLTSQTVTILGDVTELKCYDNQLTNSDVSKNPALTTLVCYKNRINGEAMTQLVNSLPNRTGMSAGTFIVMQNTPEEKNICRAADLAIAKEKNWSTQWSDGSLYSVDVGNGVSTITTAKAIGETIDLSIKANGDIIIKGVKNTPLPDGKTHRCTLTSQTVTILGDVTELKCSGNQLTDLDLTRSTALTSLNCSNNQLTGLDLSKSTALITLDCSNNHLTKLDATGCTALTGLNCQDNPLTSINLSGCQSLKGFSWTGGKLTSLDVSGCTALTELTCRYSQLTSLDVSGCTSLTNFDCQYNQLTSLDVSGCTALTTLDCQYNQLTSLDLLSSIALRKLSCYNNHINGEEMTNLVNSLPNRKGMSPGDLFVVCNDKGEGNWGSLSDVLIAREKNWNTKCQNGDPYKGVGSGVITMTTAKAIGETIKLGIKASDAIFIDGIRETPSQDGTMQSYTLTSNTLTIRGNVIELSCEGNQLTSLDVSSCTSLRSLYCQDNQLTSLEDLWKNSGLQNLSCQNNRLTSLDISGCISLSQLSCNGNSLVSFKAAGCVLLTKLSVVKQQLTTLDLSGCTSLTELDCSDNQLTSLDLSGCIALKKLSCYNNQLSILDVSQSNALESLWCYGNRLTSLDVSGSTALTELSCSNNQLTTLGISGCSALAKLDCESNKLTNLDASQTPALTSLNCNSNRLTSLDVSQNLALRLLQCQKNKLTSLVVPKESALREIQCQDNQLTNLDVSNSRYLQNIQFQNNRLSKLNASGCVALTSFSTEKQHLTSLDVSGCTSLTDLQCQESQMASLDVSGCAALINLQCWRNKLTDFKASGCTALTNIQCQENQLARLDVSGCSALAELDCSQNQLKGLDLSNNRSLRALKTYGNRINGNAMYQLISSLPNREGKSVGKFYVIDSNGSNICHQYDIELAKKKSWWLYYADGSLYAGVPNSACSITKDIEGSGTLSIRGATDLSQVPYGTTLLVLAKPAPDYKLVSLTVNGVDISATMRFVVTEDSSVKAIFGKRLVSVSLAKEGEGSVKVLGGNDLNAIANGTELTVEVTPAIGYELASLTANGMDITATKKVVVTKDTVIKATFVKKTFAVSLTKEGEGAITATGASNLNSVAYGTELTINATPAVGYELTALTANGTDILTSKKVTIKEAVEVKATFAKKPSAVVTLTKEGEGTISATGVSNLNSVAYGTELTINATPAEGYELIALTANGTDILATKKVVIKGATEVKAIFAKKSFAVSLTKEGEGRITATGVSNLNSVAYGTELTIVATPAKGYELVSITANGTDITAAKKIVIKDNMTVKATFAKKNFAVSLTKEGEGTISATGASNLNSVAYGTELTINATPAEGYELTALTANGTDILATKKIVVKDNLTVKATFTKKSFAVSLTKEGEGTISATGASNLNSVAYGTELTINATPAKGYELVSITAGGTDITASKKVVVTGNLTVKATFAKKSFAVSLTKEGEGTITATGASSLNAVAYGTELTINATPAEGYELTALTANGTDILATKKVVVEGNLTVKATFTKKSFSVSLTKEGEGTITATGASNLNSVAYGTELTINATPAKGYELVSITAGGTDITATRKIVIKDNMTITATFAKKNFAVSLTKVGEGTISATGASNLNSVAYGTELTINATPAKGYDLVSITAGGTDITATKKIVVKDNLTVKATFAKKNFAVSLTKVGEGTISATGASILNSVAYGTELTINAIPAEGYELTALTANGTNILATKKIVVEGNLTVKATFTKKTFAVTLTSNEHGDITIVEPVNLEAVSYGTTLTVKATGKNAQCELTALTANGVDILATKSFVVKGATVVKATFVDHTGVETTVTQQVQLYPNPATDHLVVEGVTPASEVTLHSMTGERLYAGRADSRGTLQIDLTPYADGVYLVCVAGETYRVVVRR